MRHRATLAIGLALVAAAPAPVEARSLVGAIVGAPLAIIGGIAGAAMGLRAARAHRRAPASRSTDVARTMPAQQGGSAWSGPVYWPYAYDSMVDYVFGTPGDGNRFWAHGYGDVLEAAFAPGRQAGNAAAKGGATRVAMNDGIRDDAKSAQPWQAMCGSENPNAADAASVRIRLAVEPTEAQAASFHELETAIARAFDRIKSSCPSSAAVTPSDRLNAMISRLTVMGQAALTMRAPLRRFYDGLSPQQKAAFDAAASGRGDAVAGNDPARAAPVETTGSATTGSAPEAARSQAIAECSQPVPDMPMAQMSRMKGAQRADMERFQAASKKLASFVATTCPSEAPAHVVDRLDAAKSRLSVLRYAALNMSSAVGRMSAAMDEQSARVRKGHERRR